MLKYLILIIITDFAFFHVFFIKCFYYLIKLHFFKFSCFTPTKMLSKCFFTLAIQTICAFLYWIPKNPLIAIGIAIKYKFQWNLNRTGASVL